MPIIEAFGMRGNVVLGKGEREKEKDTLVFIHGAGGNYTAWYPQKDHFSRDFNVVIIELPGHGAARGEGADKIRRYALWIKGSLDELEIEKPFLIGHSMGGAITMDLALRFPAIPRGLVLVGTGARLRVDPRILNGIGEDFQKTVEFICELAFSKNASQEMVRVAIEEMKKNQPDILHGDFTACDLFDIMEDIRGIKNPTLVICGDQDVLTPVTYSRYLAEKIPGAQLIIIEGAGHMIMLEKPEEFNKKLELFFRSIDRGDG